MNVAHQLKALKQLPAVTTALEMLRSQLPSTLLYHAYAHTEDVLSEVVELAITDNLATRDIELLAVAAAWHDIGFIWSNTNNEPLAADATKRYLQGSKDFSAREIELIGQMILDTALITDGTSYKQVASHPLSRYLLDADLANFGRDDFFEKSELQRCELGEDLDSFRKKTLALVCNHRWLTPAATHKWQAKKAANLTLLEKLVTSPPKN
jgi:predicted metal-dependent HD superfamily phosphohydrolase